MTYAIASVKAGLHPINFDFYGIGESITVSRKEQRLSSTIAADCPVLAE